MDCLPNTIIEFILSHIEKARDVAICNCVCKQWKDSMTYSKSLYFPRGCFDNVSFNTDDVIRRMVVSTVGLEKLVVLSPFSSDGFNSWLPVIAPTLRALELRLDNIIENHDASECQSKLECINVARNLEILELWGVLMLESPKWDTFHKLQSLQIVGARVEASAISAALEACPNLTKFMLVACEMVGSLSVNLPHLKNCNIDIRGMPEGSLRINSSKIEYLELQGFGFIRVPETKFLKCLLISNTLGRVNVVDFGNLAALKFLSMRGIQWSWDAVSKMLAWASEATHLDMKIEFTGDIDDVQPFPEIDIVDFFKSHLKLEIFEIHGAMFAALCHKNSLKKVDLEFTIPHLEDVVVTVRSPLNAEQKLKTLEAILWYGKNIKTMVVRILQMKTNDFDADDFFNEILRFSSVNHKIVRIE